MTPGEAATLCRRSAMRRRTLLATAAAAVMAPRTGHAEAFGRDPARYVFVAARQQAEISVIDGRTDILIGHIPLPGIPTQFVALGKGARLVVADAAAKQVRILDVTTVRIERSVAIPFVPRILQANRTGTMVAVLDPELGEAALLQVAGGPPMPISGVKAARYAVFQPPNAAFDREEHLLVAHGTRVAIVDVRGERNGELTADPDSGSITHLATDPGGEHAFVVQGERGVLSVFGLRDRTRAAVLRLPAPLGRVVPSADSQFALVPVGGDMVSIISNWTLQESGRIKVAGEARSVGLTLFQSVAAIAEMPGRRLLLYDLRDRRAIADLQLPGTPEFGATSPDGGRYYVALSDTGQIAVVNLTEHPTVRLIDGVGLGAWAVVPAVGDAYCH